MLQIFDHKKILTSGSQLPLKLKASSVIHKKKKKIRRNNEEEQDMPCR